MLVNARSFQLSPGLPELGGDEARALAFVLTSGPSKLCEEAHCPELATSL